MKNGLGEYLFRDYNVSRSLAGGALLREIGGQRMKTVHTGAGGMNKMYPRIDHVWIFLTDRCNLSCPHCFYQHKTSRQDLSAEALKALFGFLGASRPLQFIVSGGEPFIVWARLQSLLLRIRKEYPQAYLSVQSNGLLVKAKHLNVLAEQRANIELGIDGAESAVRKSRRGLPVDGYRRLCGAIVNARQAGVELSTTMTVTPQNVSDLPKNFEQLARLGARNIEIHPAFMADWEHKTCRLFLEGYRSAAQMELKSATGGLIGREYSLPAQGVWDMVILPGGKVLPNWTFLSFSETVRSRFYVMDLSGGTPIFLAAAKNYFTALDAFIKHSRGVPSYRRLSNFNAALAVNVLSRSAVKRKFNAYVRLCLAIEDMDRNIMRKTICRKFDMNAQ